MLVANAANGADPFSRHLCLLVMHALHAYYACMQYTLRRVPRELDRALRTRARREKKSLNEVALEALAQGLGMAEQAIVRRSIADLAGTWQDDPEFDAAIADQHTVDEDLWK